MSPTTGMADVVCIVTPRDDGPTETFIKAHVERLPGRVRLLYGGFFPKFDRDGPPLAGVATRWASGSFARLVGASGRGVLSTVMERTPRAKRDRHLARRLRDMGATVVLAEYGQTGAAIAGACELAGIPLVVHFHGYDAYATHVLEREGRHYPAMFERAAGLIAVSTDMRRQLLSLGAPEDRLHLAPYGVDLERFRPISERGVEPAFVAVGRFVDKKAPHLTVLAFRRVVGEVPGARLTMIGTGPLLEACVQLAKALGIEDAVSFPGLLPHEEVTDLMVRARAVVQHSVRPGSGDSEGTPLAILEAGASGVPVVATRHAGIVDAVAEGETGILVDELDVDAMANGMVRLANDREFALRMGDAARERISRDYSMDLHIDRLWGILRDARSEAGARE